MSDRTDRLRVAMLAFEAAPYSTGGELSEVVSGLAQSLGDEDVEVKLFSPLHPSVDRLDEVRKLRRLRSVALGNQEFPVELHSDRSRKAEDRYFIACEALFNRERIYSREDGEPDHADNFERFYVFSLAVLEALQKLDWKPHLLHCHEAHTSLLPAYLKLRCMGQPFFNQISSLLTIHNLEYQGRFEKSKFEMTGFPGELFYPMGPFEYYGELNSLKAGICYADLLNTVSPRYAREIQTEEYGCGLEEVLQRRADQLEGIVNGIDMAAWDPATDQALEFPFSASDLTGKAENSKHLRRVLGRAPSDEPLIAFVVREPHQDGLGLFLEAAGELEQIHCQWVLMDQRRGGHRADLKRLVEEKPQRFCLLEDFDHLALRRVLAGADLILIPSRFEPCGLNQMRAMRYGTIPIVRHCGGLIDTVAPLGPGESRPTGFRFFRYETGDMLSSLRSAVELWRHDRQSWEHLMRNAMARDFSWGPAARQYRRIYEKTNVG